MGLLSSFVCCVKAETLDFMCLVSAHRVCIDS